LLINVFIKGSDNLLTVRVQSGTTSNFACPARGASCPFFRPDHLLNFYVKYAGGTRDLCREVRIEKQSTVSRWKIF